jgi:hypothetical protein
VEGRRKSLREAEEAKKRTMANDDDDDDVDDEKKMRQGGGERMMGAMVRKKSEGPTRPGVRRQMEEEKRNGRGMRGARTSDE